MMDDQGNSIFKFVEGGGDTVSSFDKDTDIGDVAIDKNSFAKKPSTHNLLSNSESQVERLKQTLEYWREIMVLIHSVLLWEKNWYPGAIIGGTTFLFLSVWLLDPSILTTVCILGLTATLSDYLVPMLTATLFKTDYWSATKERVYDEFCRTAVIYNAKIVLYLSSFYAMRTMKPKFFYSCAIVTLALLAWIGNSFNNLFLTYLLTTALLLAPGIEHHGILYKYRKFLSKKLADCSFLKGSNVKWE